MILDFLSDYRDLIIICLSVLSLIATIVFAFIGEKKSHAKKIAAVFAMIPDFIIQAEATNQCGSRKYQFVFNLVLSELEALGISKAVALKKYSGLIDSAIESILKTPQKKVR